MTDAEPQQNKRTQPPPSLENDAMATETQTYLREQQRLANTISQAYKSHGCFRPFLPLSPTKGQREENFDALETEI